MRKIDLFSIAQMLQARHVYSSSAYMQDREWLVIAEQLSQETDRQRVTALVNELCRALDRTRSDKAPGARGLKSPR